MGGLVVCHVEGQLMEIGHIDTGWTSLGRPRLRCIHVCSVLRAASREPHACAVCQVPNSVGGCPGLRGGGAGSMAHGARR